MPHVWILRPSFLHREEVQLFDCLGSACAQEFAAAAQVAEGVCVDGVGVREDKIVAELPALEEAVVTDVGDEMGFVEVDV